MQGSHGLSFLAPLDQIGLCLLLGFYYLVQNRLHVTGQDDVLDPDTQQIDAMGMAGVGEKEVDEIILRFGEELKAYQASLTSGEVLSAMERTDALPGEEDLSCLEAEILREAARTATEEPASSEKAEGGTEKAEGGTEKAEGDPKERVAREPEAMEE